MVFRLHYLLIFRLNDLVILSVENNLLAKLDLKSMIKDFASTNTENKL